MLRTAATVSSDTPDILYNTLAEVEYPLDVRRATDGAHIVAH